MTRWYDLELVVDANVLFSALIKDGVTRRLLINSGWRFYAPEFIFEEIRKHSNYLSNKIGTSKSSLWQMLEEFLMYADIQIIPFSEFREFYIKFRKISPDINDAHYLALAAKFSCAVWTNDKELQKQSDVRICTTNELFEILSGKNKISRI